MLVIRTGRADETLPTAGVTHLVEHLALPATSRRTLEFQGSVDNILTQFVATGDPAKVGAFLTQTAEQLRSLPRERLESERRILLAEEATQPYSAVRLAYALRFGPAGQGLTGYDEWGLRRLSADDVQAWSNGRFVSGNAALWLTGAPPDELAPVLPDGGAVLAPEPKDLDDLRLPALSREGADGSFLLSLVAERSHAFKLALGVLEHRLRDHLRYRLGLTYGVEVVFMPMTATSVHVAVIADAAGASATRAVQEAREVVADLAANGPTVEELEHEWLEAREQAGDPHDLSSLYYETVQLLLGAPDEPEPERLAAREAVTSHEVAAAMAAAAASMLVIAPLDTPDLDGLAEYPLSSSTRVEGRRYRLRGNPLRREARDVSLTASDEGFTLAAAGGFARTVLYRSAALARRNDDGSRTLVSHDGFFVSVDPADWRDGNRLIAAIDASIDPAIVVAETPALDRMRRRVEELADEYLQHRRWIKDELEALPALLEEGEEPRMLLKGWMGWSFGVVALTDRRVVHVYGHELKADVPLASIQTVVSTGGRQPNLVLDTDSGKVTVGGLEPWRRAGELAERVRTAADAAR
jgi:hypothetical protein